VQENDKSYPRNVQKFGESYPRNMAHLQKDVFSTSDLNNVYKGHIAEHIVGQELLVNQTSILSKPLFWVSEKKDSSSE